ncbi:hypothetical protein [Brachyspira alvinipulli]|uniref:hypothetical protein n=1 Tax=Brachyspira alvinipulli TaxID=84379 RepID=UPI000480899C|nr:hypothetical protein [Brachyspira alvinipulli]
MKNIVFILIFTISSIAYSITFYADENFLKKHFNYDKKLDTYVFNKNKVNTLSFHTLKVEDDLFVVQTIIKQDKELYGLKEVRFNNKEEDIFVIPNIDLMHVADTLVFISLSNIDDDNSDKLIEFFSKGNVYLEYVAEDDIYRYKINNKTSKIFAEVLKCNIKKLDE